MPVVLQFPGLPPASVQTVGGGSGVYAQVVGGDGQSALGGATLPVALQVLVTDPLGKPFPGQSVTFSIASGGGSLSSGGAATTDSRGIASVSWTLGSVVGAQSVSVNPHTGQTLGFTATATQAVSASLSTVSATSPITLAGGSATTTVTVTVLDTFGQPIAGVRPLWNPPGSTILTGMGNTNAAGVSVGTATFVAAADRPIVITVNGVTLTQQPTVVILGPVSAGLSTVSATSPVNVNTLDTVTVTAKDSASHLLSGQTVTLSVSGTGNTVTQPGSATDGSGVATGSFQSSVAETKVITAVAGGVTITQQPSVVVNSGGATPIFQDNFASGSKAGAQNGYSWGAGVPVAKAPDGTYGLQFTFGPDSLGDWGGVIGTGANGSFTRTDGGTWDTSPSALHWSNAGGKTDHTAFLYKPDGSHVSFTVTSFNATTLFFTGDATGCTEVWGEAFYGSAIEQYFVLGDYLDEVWIQYDEYVPANYVHRMHHPTIPANNKWIYLWGDTYADKSNWEVGSESYNNTVAHSPQPPPDLDSLNTTYQRPTTRYGDSSYGSGLVTTVQPPYDVNTTATAGDIWVGAGGLIVPGQWTTFGWHFRSSSAVGVLDGIYQLYLNGALVFQKTGLPNYGSATPFAKQLKNGYLMGAANSGYTDATTFYITNVKIYNTNPGWPNNV